VHTRFWRGDLRKTDHLEDPDVDGMLILKCIVKKCDGNIKLIDPARIGTGGRLL
jgi:hypothetical protein